jgi:hemoglobin-like flavoprotein
MMKQEQIKLVQDTFAQVQPIADEAAAMFYRRLFELDPALRPLFKHNLEDQGVKLMTTLTVVVHSLNKPENITGLVKRLGVRHTGYGVRDEHYATVGAALLWTLKTALAEAFTGEVEAAWTEAYYLLAGLMQEAAVEIDYLPQAMPVPG